MAEYFVWCPNKSCNPYKAPEQLCEVCAAVNKTVKQAVTEARQEGKPVLKLPPVTFHVVESMRLQEDAAIHLRAAIEETDPVKMGDHLLKASTLMVQAHESVLRGMTILRNRVCGRKGEV